MNDYLKDFCGLCEFNEPITVVCYRAGKREEDTYPKYELIGTHAGRRTFICFALSSGIPPQVVMKWTGHSDYKAMRPYIDIADYRLASTPDQAIIFLQIDQNNQYRTGKIMQYNPATGGKSQFNHRLTFLKGRKIIAFPDIDAYHDWLIEFLTDNK